MKEFTIEQKRNVALAGHHGAGKTSLVEAMLFHLGVIDRLGKTEDGTAFCDHTDEERARHFSIYATLVCLEPKGCRINLLDLPGYPDFIAEVKGGLHVVDGVVMVLDASSGVEVETERAWEYADEFGIPRIAVINRMDKERADFRATVARMNEVFNVSCVPFHLPLGQEADFKGVVDLVKMKALYFNSKGKVEKEDEVPADLQGEAEEYRDKIMDFAAETDEEVMAKYLEGEALTEEEIINGLRKGVAERSFVPVFCSSADNLIGISSLMDAMTSYLPSPAQRGEIEVEKPAGGTESIKPTPDSPLAAYVFKTIVDPFAGRLSFLRIYAGTLTLEKPFYNSSLGKSERANNILGLSGKQHLNINKAVAGDIAVLPKLDSLKTGHTLCDENHPVVIQPTAFPGATIQMALRASSKAEEEKLGTCLPRIVEEDPTLSTRRDADTRELILSGMGELHLNIVADRLKSQFGLTTNMKVPQVAYKETITVSGDGKYRHKKQSGGRGQFGEVVMKLEPLPRGEGFEFVNAIVGGKIPAKFVISVEKGVVEAMSRGVLAGHPIIDVKVTLYDGMTHSVDSSDIAFKIAGSMGFKLVALGCKPILLEPIMNVEVTVPEEYMGDIMGDFNSKRGKIMGMDPHDGRQVIRAQVPLAEMFQYSIDLRSMTQARGSFAMEFSHYVPVPHELSEKIIAEARKEKAGQEAD